MSRSERALTMVRDVDQELVEQPRAGLCAHCDDPIPTNRKLDAIYCGDGCRRAAHWERQAA